MREERLRKNRGEQLQEATLRGVEYLRKREQAIQKLEQRTRRLTAQNTRDMLDINRRLHHVDAEQQAFIDGAPAREALFEDNVEQGLAHNRAVMDDINQMVYGTTNQAEIEKFRQRRAAAEKNTVQTGRRHR